MSELMLMVQSHSWKLLNWH